MERKKNVLHDLELRIAESFWAGELARDAGHQERMRRFDEMLERHLKAFQQAELRRAEHLHKVERDLEKDLADAETDRDKRFETLVIGLQSDVEKGHAELRKLYEESIQAQTRFLAAAFSEYETECKQIEHILKRVRPPEEDKPAAKAAVRYQLPSAGLMLTTLLG